MDSGLSFTQDFDNHELLDISSAARKFAERELRPPAGKTPQFNRSHFENFGKLGFAGMSLPESLGGSGVSPLTIASVIFETARADLGPAIYLGVHLMVSRLLHHLAASESPVDEKIGATLREMADGRKLGAFCLTEANAGSDAANLQTKAEKKAGAWTLTGEKIYITSAGFADVYFVFARTGGARKEGISAFLVERGASGLSFGTPERKMGCESSPIASVFFSDTPAVLLGNEGAGFQNAMNALSGGRVNIAACACALSSRAIELASAHLKQREQFGRALSEFQALRFMLSDMWIKLRASVLLTRDACLLLEKDPSQQREASAAKCFATDSAMQTTVDAVQLLGGAGYLAEYEVERLMRDAKMLQIVEGTNQIQRLVIAKSILGK